MTTLPREFYDRPVLEVAPELLGCVLSLGECSGMIVETEAYHESEPACHAFRGPAPRLDVLFGEPGLAYVYRSYGIHALVNAVCEPAGVGAAVLIRALEPIDGLDLMFERRVRSRERASVGRAVGRTPSTRAPLRDQDLCNGPGKLTQALGIALDRNGASLIDGAITISERFSVPATTSSPRIGITHAVDLPWRFSVTGNRHVSPPRPRASTGSTAA